MSLLESSSQERIDSGSVLSKWEYRICITTMFSGILVHRGFISQSPEWHNYRSEFWHHAQLANLCSPGPCRALGICGEDNQMPLWNRLALLLPLGAFWLFSCYSGECILLALLRGMQVAQACGRHSQGLSSFLWAGSSLYLASYALKHWLLASAKGQSPKVKNLWFDLFWGKASSTAVFVEFKRRRVSRTHRNKAWILSLNLDSSFERKQSILLGFDFPWYKHCPII